MKDDEMEAGIRAGGAFDAGAVAQTVTPGSWNQELEAPRIRRIQRMGVAGSCLCPNGHCRDFPLAQFCRTRYPFPMQDYREIITLELGKRGGKPCIRHMRITVYDILGWLAAGMTTDEILADYPELTKQDVQASLAFAADRDHHLVVGVA